MTVTTRGCSRAALAAIFLAVAFGSTGCWVGSQGFDVGWRCTAFDSRGREWYWHAAEKRSAIDNARSACQEDSPVGGCGVRPGDCMPL